MVHRYTHSYSRYFADDKKEVFTRFANGEVDCLITCHKLSQGIDIADLQSVVLFASNRERLETTQRLGRCLRSDPNNPSKRAVVVDFVRPQTETASKKPSSDTLRSEWLEGLSKTRRKE